MRILLVEDDEILSTLLMKTLTEQRYVVDLAEAGDTGLSYAQAAHYDLLILDVGLPQIDGITLCQRLRSEGSSMPILLMTAKDVPDERIRGLDAGADDYLTKPFNLAELQARMRALLRRREVATTSVLTLGLLRLDPVSCDVTYGGQRLKLTPKEYSLLELMLRNPARVFSRGQLIEHLWTFDDPPLEDSVKAHIKGLRRQLKKVGITHLVENVYGLGYKLDPAGVPTLAGDALPQTPHSSPETSTPDSINVMTGLGATAPLDPMAINPSIDGQFDQAVEILWDQYQGLMAERLTALQQAVAAIEVNGLTEPIRQQAGQAAHKLAGVLGMFNREAGTTLARQLETILLAEPTLLKLAKVPDLVQQLSTLLNLSPVGTEPVLPEWPARLLLVTADQLLAKALQQVTQSHELGWQVVITAAAAEHWLQSQTPDLLVIDADSESATLGPLLAIASQCTPPIPTLVLLAEAALADRVEIATQGAHILTKGMSASQIWATAVPLMQQSQAHSISVLAVDDDPILLKALRPLLEPWGMRLTPLEQASEFWPVLQQTRPDLLILDVEMPDFDGIELCQAVRSDPQWQDLPIVFLTAHRDRKTVQRIFAAGADDYITKPLLGPELITRITNRLERNRLLQTLSRQDAKTGLYNHPHASQVIQTWLQQALPFTLVVLQLTELSDINLTYGHLLGHQILQRWGTTLQGQLKGTALLSYWENGDFVLGLLNLNKSAAQEQLITPLKMLRQQIFTAPDGHRLQPTYQVGFAAAPGDAQNLQQLYQIAVKTAS